MTNHIVSASLNLFDGVLDATMAFRPGLNILAGENGTLKTQVLKQLKDAKDVSGKVRRAESSILRVQAISPKRNLELRNTEQLLDFLRHENRTMEKVVAEVEHFALNDRTFPRYPTFGELFYLTYEEAKKDGRKQIDAMEEVASSLNGVVQRVFTDYVLLSTWNPQRGAPELAIKKRNARQIPLDGLSLGESEVLALTANLFASRGAFDVYLIDEPENHLNWHLEKRLFGFLDWFCDQHQKQAIVATHSRVVFQQPFLARTQFLSWNEDGHIAVTSDVSREIQESLAGDAVEIIRLGDFSRPTFFVEDNEHEVVVSALAEALGVSVNVTRCDNSQVVRTLFRYSKADGGWRNSFFLEDGDNEGNPYPGEPQFLHLGAYCIECYMLDPELSGASLGVSPDVVQEHMYRAILERKVQILKKNKWLDFLLDRLQPGDLIADRVRLLDASLVLEPFLRGVGKTFKEYVRVYINTCQASGSIDRVFPEQLLSALRTGTREPARGG
ncbi:MAG: AAA family ATPase [Candidatus Bipolaricaulota bacterium]|nr:AAA family ATPase [Candidatus Bipolaricaulota bacterium]